MARRYGGKYSPQGSNRDDGETPQPAFRGARVDPVGARSNVMFLPPILLAAGFTLLGSSLGLVLFAAVQVAQRALNYGLLGPVKEMLFTVVDRETKYKSKNFIDTAVYRGSDVTASWIFKGLVSSGFSLAQIAWMYLPVMGLWGYGAWRLGRLYNDLRARATDDTPAPEGRRPD